MEEASALFRDRDNIIVAAEIQNRNQSISSNWAAKIWLCTVYVTGDLKESLC